MKGEVRGIKCRSRRGAPGSQEPSELGGATQRNAWPRATNKNPSREGTQVKGGAATERGNGKSKKY